MKLTFKSASILCCVSISFCGVLSQAAEKDIRDVMLSSAKEKDPDFPDSKSSKLTNFSYVCKLRTGEKIVHVVNHRQVLTGMPAPRGARFISLFDGRGKFLSKYRYDQGEPLWCEKDQIYLFGGYQGPLQGNCVPSCNVMKVDSKGGASLLHEKAYGSSGGILDE